MSSTDRSKFLMLVKRWREDIFAYVREGLRVDPTEQQGLLLQPVQDWNMQVPGAKNKIACKSGQGPGKTFTSVGIMTQRTLRNRGAKAVITAPTMRQVRQVWLREAYQILGRAHPLLRKYVNVTKSCIVFGGEANWVIEATTSSKAVNAQGHHHPNMTIGIDEAAGLDHAVWEQWEGTVTQKDNLLFAFGNPNLRACPFFDCFYKFNERWHGVTLNAEDSPDWLVNKDNHKYLAEKYGRDSDVYRVRVLGEFPSEDPRAIISADALMDCQKIPMESMTESARLFTTGVARSLGIDLARYGGDESVIVTRVGNSIIDMRTYRQEEPIDILNKAKAIAAAMGFLRDPQFSMVPDSNGLGGGALAVLRDVQTHYFFSQGKPVESIYKNKITEAWFMFAEYVRQRKVSIPKDPLLFEQLTTRWYQYDEAGKIKIESKEKYCDRGYPSPDRADAVVMAFYDYAKPRAYAIEGGATKKVGFKGKERQSQRWW